MLKLVVSDLDGTLLPYGSDSVSHSVKSKIKALTERGVIFALASGRNYSELIRLFSEFSEKAYFIAADGAYTVKSGRIIYSRAIPREELDFLVKQSAGAPLIFFGAERSYAHGTPPSSEIRSDTAFIKSALDIPSGEKIFKAVKFGAPVKLPPYSGIRIHWDGRQIGVTEYVNRFANKGAALSDLKIRLNVPESSTVVIGDMTNDLSLFKGAKHRIAVGDRCPELLELATERAACGEEALARILDEI